MLHVIIFLQHNCIENLLFIGEGIDGPGSLNPLITAPFAQCYKPPAGILSIENVNMEQSTLDISLENTNLNKLNELPSTFEEVQLTEEEEKYFM